MPNLFLPLVMVAMIGFMFYSQRKQQKQRQEALSQIKKGDEIVTIGGLFGIVDEINDKKVVLDVDGVYLTFERGAIRNRVATANTAPVVAEETVVETTKATSASVIEE
ncbi:preprotein translocase subunit YajC [Streptococcus ruminantium]|uniref:Preprotein translocase subunit YajC n=1 Tax=Streptococcus ruminantium TaxID=1917441 RepID=A0ABU1B315_9STRE|nr:preprotein translocase subunit YajC [Streptococcus ruminantium]MDQ8758687.1 preprotein translocase subunit YajC [Streptococcus ruminantium]MDQ8765177.1 preprotein translocase subunit YajC [Streptococcus ruminantium]MDQ8767089.1 preprotein translocase subunit YajC [Streptococcus ruminantium]MDQ8769250.1 preprotein translocase subunit YajC [Streptococcus ruminantium]MDQ8774036.1 preprotein translocase subunit YajC [Streptococcus ruminantium]